MTFADTAAAMQEILSDYTTAVSGVAGMMCRRNMHYCSPVEIAAAHVAVGDLLVEAVNRLSEAQRAYAEDALSKHREHHASNFDRTIIENVGPMLAGEFGRMTPERVLFDVVISVRQAIAEARKAAC